jgi:hypothetical protein
VWRLFDGGALVWLGFSIPEKRAGMPPSVIIPKGMLEVF